MFSIDVMNMKEAAAKCSLPQAYDADERETLDTQLALFNAPPVSLKKFKTGTKMYTAQVSRTSPRSNS